MVKGTQSPRARLEAAHRLRWLRERAGIKTAKEAAQKFKWNYNTYKSHESGTKRNISKQAATRYKKAFNVSLDFLLTGAQPPPDWEGQPGSPARRVRIRTVPKLSAAQAVRLLNPKVDPLSIAEDEIAIDAGSDLSDDLIAYEIEGDDMVDKNGVESESFPHGSVVVIDRKAQAKPGDFVLAAGRDSDHSFFRKYRTRGKDPRGHEVIELVPLNPDYETIVLSSKRPGKIIGRMVRHIRKY